MAGRRRPGPDEDPGYDWMFDQQTNDAPDPTRVMPQVPPEPDGPQHVPPPRQPQPPPRRPAKRRRLRPFRLLLLLVVLWLIYLVAVPIFTWSEVQKVAFEPGGERPPEQPGTTYLMIGSDSRAGLSKAERKELATGNAQSSLADTIMVLHTGSGPNVLLSFPRDWTVDGRKINGRYDPGDPTELVATLEQQTGIRIDEYVEIGLGGVAGVVDAVGGVEICPKKRMKDPKAGLNVKKGCQEADGPTALGYARTRQGGLGDLERVGRQREVVGAVGSSVLSPWTFINPLRWWRLNQAVPDFFGFGEGTNQVDVSRWAMAMTRAGDARTCTMPVTSGSATTMDEGRARPLFEAIINDRTDDITNAQCTPTGIAP